MAISNYIGITESKNSPTGEEHFYFTDTISGGGIPVNVVYKVWEKYHKPSNAVKILRRVPHAGVEFNLVKIEKQIDDETCKELKQAILNDNPQANHFDIYVFKEGSTFCILNLSFPCFNVLKSLPEYSKYHQHRYKVESIPVINYPNSCYCTLLNKFRESINKGEYEDV